LTEIGTERTGIGTAEKVGFGMRYCTEKGAIWNWNDWNWNDLMGIIWHGNSKSHSCHTSIVLKVLIATHLRE